MDDQGHVLERFEVSVEADEIKPLGPVKAQRLHAGPFFELTGHHAHKDQIAAVNPLKALGDDRFHPKQPRPFGGPVT